MTLSENLKIAFDRIEQHYGSRGAAAKAMGYTPQHYRILRKGRRPILKRTADYILMKAQELSAPEAPPPPNNEVETRL